MLVNNHHYFFYKSSEGHDESWDPLFFTENHGPMGFECFFFSHLQTKIEMGSLMVSSKKSLWMEISMASKDLTQKIDENWMAEFTNEFCGFQLPVGDRNGVVALASLASKPLVWWRM